MNLVFFACIIAAQVDLSGYVETRPYVAWNDSTTLSGYNRGWLELKTDEAKYGAQAAFDLVVPFDTNFPVSIFDDIQVSRLAVWFGDERARIVAGKQVLYWGVGRVFRPLDVFNRANYLEPGYERAGTNALLGYFSPGGMVSFRGIVVPSGDIDRTVAGIRAGANVRGNDIGLTAMHQPVERLTMIGGELAGEFAAGYWLELANTWHDTIDYTRLTAGLDYTFPLAIYAMAEYFFDGSGASDPASYDYGGFAAGERQTMAQHYLYASIGISHNPFLRPSVSSITNLDDGGTIIIPQVAYALFDNAEVVLGLNYAFGRDDSEFRTVMPYRGAVYVWASVYF